MCLERGSAVGTLNDKLRFAANFQRGSVNCDHSVVVRSLRSVHRLLLLLLLLLRCR